MSKFKIWMYLVLANLLIGYVLPVLVTSFVWWDFTAYWDIAQWPHDARIGILFWFVTITMLVCSILELKNQ